MRELDHRFLFNPPAQTGAVVVPVVAQVEAAPPATFAVPMTNPYAQTAKRIWRKFDVNVGVLTYTRGGVPHPLTTIDNGRIYLPGKTRLKPLRFHLVSLPTRPYAEVGLDPEYLSTMLCALARLFDGRVSHLADVTNIALPRIADAAAPWPTFRDLMAIWLDDRFIVFSCDGEPT